MTDPVPSKERIGFLIDYWTAKWQSHKRWPEGQGMQAELIGLIYEHTIAALRHLHSASEPRPLLNDEFIGWTCKCGFVNLERTDPICCGCEQKRQHQPASSQPPGDVG